MRSTLKINAIKDFKGQKAYGVYSFEMQKYAVLEIWPYELFGLDAEIKKTIQALYVKVKNIESGTTAIFYCSEIKIENE